MKSATLSTRCDITTYKQIQQTAKEEWVTIRKILEDAWKHYHSSRIREKIIESYKNIGNDDISIAEEDMNDYYSMLQDAD